MEITVRGAREHNLKKVDVQFPEGLTVVTGVSGSGKTSLVFDTVYHEAHRRLLNVIRSGRSGAQLSPAEVDSISGLGPAVAVTQNVLNRNPLSTLASASGLHPFLRILYTHYGSRSCLSCGNPLAVRSGDEIVERLISLSKGEPLKLFAPLLHGAKGSHATLLSYLTGEYGKEKMVVDGDPWKGHPLDPAESHDIHIEVGRVTARMNVADVRILVHRATTLGAGAVRVAGRTIDLVFASAPLCSVCRKGFRNLEPTHFNQCCPYCKGEGCDRCGDTGMHPQAASVRWEGKRLPELLSHTVSEVRQRFLHVELPSSADRLCTEIQRRLDALEKVGLGYLALDRSVPTLSRGESQRVRLAISLSSRLEDMIHVLDEPTIGQHPADVTRFLPAFRDLPGSVIYVEHDRVAAAAADHAIDLGPGAGKEGGKITFSGSPEGLWRTDTPTGRFFSLRTRVMTPQSRSDPERFLVLRGTHRHNLKHVDITIPLGRLTVISGVSGSGKSTVVEHVLVPTLTQHKATGCDSVEGPRMEPVLVTQAPIGRNPRSNPATYTKLSDIIRDLFASHTDLSKSCFSFNRPEGACPVCRGMGATEVRMVHLPSVWIPCARCDGRRFNETTLNAEVPFQGRMLSIGDLYSLSIAEVRDLLLKSSRLSPPRRETARRILQSLCDVGLGYLAPGQPSTTLSGGEAQRVKLAKYLGGSNLQSKIIILDEPSTGLHPQDLDGLLKVLDRLVRSGATVVVVEHNTDVIRAADWVVDLGPGAGPEGGHVLYSGPAEGLFTAQESLTGKALNDENAVRPDRRSCAGERETTSVVAIRNARAHNLRGIDVKILKEKFTVITGVSGSGKSSLMRDILEAEARRRYLETLSMYERQGIREGAEAPVDSITGLGVVLHMAPHLPHLWSAVPQFTRRNTVGTASELSIHIGVLFAEMGERSCLECGSKMNREDRWICPRCDATAPLAQARHFSSSHWASSCDRCNGLGTVTQPQPQKLIVSPDKPLCAGAMHSPGYWPKTYLCKDQPLIPAMGERYGFDPFRTPWNRMPPEAQKAFLYGDNESYTITYRSKSTGRMKGKLRSHTWKWHGFYGRDSWLWHWDVHGTYTTRVTCPACNGAGLRTEFLAVTVREHTIHDLFEMPLTQLEKLLTELIPPDTGFPLLQHSYHAILERLRFLRKVGLGYLHLNRTTGTLSAGEAQRIQLAGLLGSGLTNLTLLMDEPSRGMHPAELEALRDALGELRDGGNTVIVVEHDPVLIRAADHVIDLGPGAGRLGGEVVAAGTPEEIISAGTLTGRWLQRVVRRSNGMETGDSGRLSTVETPRGRPNGWMVIKGARAHNLQGIDVTFPLQSMTGICGVSGSGKSTLLVDTLGRALIRRPHTSSFAKDPVDPGQYDAIEHAPERAVLIDQSRRGVRSPAVFLGMTKHLLKLCAGSDDARALGLDEKALGKACSVCKGSGRIRIDMGFLPDEFVECEVCRGTGYRPEAWEVRVKGIPLPEINALTLDDVYDLLDEEEKIRERLEMARRVGLGYLVWRQPHMTLSGGEVQRLKIAKELGRTAGRETLYILDEPTVGLHMEDVDQLVEVLMHLVDAGNTVLVVEHNPLLLAAADWLVELGPGGGPEGGRVIASGTPDDVSRMKTPTAPYIAEIRGVKP
jgi:excinuclease ABC subunit A